LTLKRSEHPWTVAGVSSMIQTSDEVVTRTDQPVVNRLVYWLWAKPTAEAHRREAFAE